MKETTKITMDITKDDLLQMLSVYYSEKLNKQINVKLNVISSIRGYGMGEYTSTDVDFYFETEESIGNIKVKVTNSLSKEDIKIALNDILEKSNYSVESVQYKTGSQLVGYCMNEHEEPYSNGVTLKVRQKGIERKLK